MPSVKLNFKLAPTIGDKIVDTFTLLPLFRHCDPFLPSWLGLSTPLTTKQCCVATAVTLSYKQPTLNGGAGSFSIDYCAVKKIVLVGALEVLLKDNVSTYYVADCRSFLAVQLLYNTVGYLRENGRWPLNRGWWCTLTVFSLSGYKFLLNIEPIQGNHDRREPFFCKIASDSFFPNNLSPFRQRPLPLQWPEIPSRALHLLDAGPEGETTYMLCRKECK